MKTNYLVLIDFSETSKNALKSALNLTSLNGGKVVALHVLSSDKKEEKNI
ncbi:MAG: universal stress protein [Flavobacteriales bacterium]